MNKRTLKLIYKLIIKGLTDRKIKKELSNKYNIYAKTNAIYKIIKKIPVKRNTLQEYEEKIVLKLYKEFYDTNKVIIYVNKRFGLNLSVQWIRDLAHKRNVKKSDYNSYSQSKISKTDEKKICELYENGLSSIEIAKLYGYKQKKSILDKLKKYEVEMRKSYDKQVNNKLYKDFDLERIDTPQKAYLIGLLITDGYICKERGYVGIDLTDKDAIEYLANYINCSIMTIKTKNKNHLDKYRITLYSEKLLSQLERFGVIENKTFITSGCNLEDDEKQFLPYIIRGIIDGDGWIAKNKKEFFISSASLSFIQWCSETLIKLGFESISYKYIPNKSNGIYIIRTGIKKNMKLLKKIIYPEPMGMNRKYNLLYQ